MTLFYSFLHNEFDRRPRGCVTFFFENEVCPNIKTEIEDKYCKIEFRQGVAVNDVLCDDDDDGVRVFSSAVFSLLSPLFGLFRTLRTYNLPPVPPSSRLSTVS